MKQPLDRPKQGPRSAPRRRHANTLHVAEAAETASDGDTDDTAYTLFSTSGGSSQPMTATLNVNGVELQMEVDMGASASIISQTTYQKSWPTHASPLQPSNVKLRTCTGEELKVLWSLATEVQYLNQKARLHLLVVGGSGPRLLGRD